MYRANINGREYSIEVIDGEFHINGKVVNADIIHKDDKELLIKLPNKVIKAFIIDNSDPKNPTIKVRNTKFKIEVKDKHDLLLEKLGMDSMVGEQAEDLLAPMPGLVLDTKVSSGDSIVKGDVLLVLEAMKMENVIKSAHDGVVKSVEVKAGAAVEKNEVLVTFE